MRVYMGHSTEYFKDVLEKSIGRWNSTDTPHNKQLLFILRDYLPEVMGALNECIDPFLPFLETLSNANDADQESFERFLSDPSLILLIDLFLKKNLDHAFIITSISEIAENKEKSRQDSVILSILPFIAIMILQCDKAGLIDEAFLNKINQSLRALNSYDHIFNYCNLFGECFNDAIDEEDTETLQLEIQVFFDQPKIIKRISRFNNGDDEKTQNFFKSFSLLKSGLFSADFKTDEETWLAAANNLFEYNINFFSLPETTLLKIIKSIYTIASDAIKGCKIGTDPLFLIQLVALCLRKVISQESALSLDERI